MSETIKVDVGNEDLFKPPEFPTITPGIHAFAVASIGDWEPSKTDGSTNLVLQVDLRCQDDEVEENNGLACFENFVLVTEVTDQKSATTKKMNEQRMAQFCLSCGVTTQQQILETGELPIKACEGQFLKAQTGIKINEYQGEKTPKTYVKKYLFESE